MTKTIASIYYFKAQTIERPLYAGKFSLQPVKKGDAPFLLTIKDHQQIETLPYFKGTTSAGRQRQERIQVTGEEIANDLILHWTTQHPDATPECRPGIWIVRETVALTDEHGKPVNDADGLQSTRPATQQEKDIMFAEDLESNTECQANWAQKGFDRGNMMADDPKKVPFISDLYRESAKYLGVTPTWLRKNAEIDTKMCPLCTKVIAAAAIKCPNCAEIIDAARYSAHQAALRAAKQETKPAA
jgi:hypothetical protein